MLLILQQIIITIRNIKYFLLSIFKKWFRLIYKKKKLAKEYLQLNNIFFFFFFHCEWVNVRTCAWLDCRGLSADQFKIKQVVLFSISQITRSPRYSDNARLIGWWNKCLFTTPDKLHFCGAMGNKNAYISNYEYQRFWGVC